LAQSGNKRSPFIPDVPTFREAGFEVLLEGWNAFYVPKGTPPEIVKILNDAANVALKDPDVAKRLETVASVPVGGTPAELSKLIEIEGSSRPRCRKDHAEPVRPPGPSPTNCQCTSVPSTVRRRSDRRCCSPRSTP
jgi:tripartite-type tricarboxylate transporter receptor subunit TctC